MTGLLDFPPLLLAQAFGDVEPEEWQQYAVCAQTDGEAFFPEKGGSTREAKRICRGCPVQAECLAYALAHDERFGVWGGTSERERRRLKPPTGQASLADCANTLRALLAHGPALSRDLQAKTLRPDGKPYSRESVIETLHTLGAVYDSDTRQWALPTVVTA